jgi:hypothetical protein
MSKPTLHLKKGVMKQLKSTFIEVRGDAIQLHRLADDSFMISFYEDSGGNPELLVGCVGQWINTDDYEFAVCVFDSLVAADATKQLIKQLINKKESVSDCLKWRSAIDGLRY